MPNMPVIPALNSPTGGVPGPLTDVLDAMLEDDVAELCAVAAEWSVSAEADTEIVDDPDATAETDTDTPEAESMPGDDPVEHGDETLEEEVEETPEVQAEEAESGIENFEGLMSQVQAEGAKGGVIAEELDTLVEQAQAVEAEGGDPDAILGLKEEATEYLDEIVTLLQEADKAMADEDANGLAQVGLLINEKNGLIEALVAKARIHAQANTPPAQEAGTIPTTPPALSLWATRYSPD